MQKKYLVIITVVVLIIAFFLILLGTGAFTSKAEGEGPVDVEEIESEDTPLAAAPSAGSAAGNITPVQHKEPTNSASGATNSNTPSNSGSSATNNTSNGNSLSGIIGQIEHAHKDVSDAIIDYKFSKVETGAEAADTIINVIVPSTAPATPEPSTTPTTSVSTSTVEPAHNYLSDLLAFAGEIQDEIKQVKIEKVETGVEIAKDVIEHIPSFY